MIQEGPQSQPRTEVRRSDRDRPPRTGGVKPGTEDVTVVDDRSQPQPQERQEMVTRKERKVAKSILPFVLAALIIATVVTAFMTRRWEFLLALLVFVPYLFLISAPLWLGASSKVAQDENARQRGRATGNPPKGPEDLPPRSRGPTEPNS